MKNLKSFLLCVLTISAGFAYAQNGEEIFKTKCTSCHSIGKGIVVGPDLKDIHKDKDMNEQWLQRFIRSSQTLINSGDMHAKETYEKFKKIIMPDQPLSEAEINSVIAYIKSESEKPNEKIAASVSAAPAEIHNQPVAAPQQTSGTFFNNFWFALIILFFLAIIVVLARVISALSSALEEEYKNKKNQ